MIRAFTNYFADAGFAQVHPPVITSSDCEGAGEAFVVRPAAAPSPPEGGDKGAEYFGAPKYLTVSSQLHLEAMAQGLGAVWALAPVFRAEDSDTGRHLSEFYMLEAELAFADSLDVVMDLAESCLASSTRRLQETSGEAWIDRPWENEANARSLVGAEGASATILAKETAALRWKGITQKTNPWPRITYTEAMGILSKHADRFEHKPMWGAELQTEHEKFLALEVGGADSTLGHVPVFVTHYPRDTKAFYMAPSDSPQGPTVACFDLLLPGTGELVGGSLREHRLEPLVAAMRRCGIAPGPSMDWYLDLRRWGCPPHGGFGVGVDRLLSWLTAIPNVRDTATFPRWSGRCDC
jgi:asparaginyl-tRNA synthetase